MISVILCTYRSESIIQRTMEAILSNTLKPREILLVDNASPDATVRRAEEVFRTRADADIDLKVLINPIPGVAGSREMGIRAVRGDLAVFVDDDNILSPTYLAYIEDFFNKHEQVHMLCSRGELPRHIIIPEGFDERKLRHYAIGDIITSTGSILDKDYIWSAGLAFRTATMQRFFKRSLRLRCGQSKDIMAGEDTEIFQWYRIKGLDVWFTTENSFEHHIDPARLEERYFRRLRATQSQAGQLIDRHYGGILRFSRYARNLFSQFTLYDARQTLRGLIQMMARPGQFITGFKILTA